MVAQSAEAACLRDVEGLSATIADLFEVGHWAIFSARVVETGAIELTTMDLETVRFRVVTEDNDATV